MARRRESPAPLGPFGRMLCLVYVAGLGLHLFILPGHLTTNLTRIFWPAAAASLDDQPLHVHWIVVLAGLVLGYFVFRILARRPLGPAPRARLVVGLAVVLGLALVAGLVVERDLLSVVYYLQTVIPLLGFFVGAYLADSAAGIRKTAAVFVAATTLSIVFVLLLALSTGAIGAGWEASQRLARAVHQLRDYFPVTVAVSLSLALAILELVVKKSHKVFLLTAIAAHILFYTVTWSRTAILMALTVVALPLALSLRTAPRGILLRRLVVASALLIGGAALVWQFSILTMRWQRDGFRESDKSRVRYAVAAAKIIAKQPVFGRMMIPDWEQDRNPPRILRVRRMFKSHNQYLDYGVRAGLPAMLLLGWIIVSVARDLRFTLRRSRSHDGLRPLVIGVAGALLAVALGSCTYVPLVQAQTGSLTWLLVGVAARMAEMARSDGDLQTAAAGSAELQRPASSAASPG